MRGALRIQVVTILALAGAATGALAGLLAGVVWWWVGLPAATTNLALGMAGVVAAVEIVGRPSPPAVRRQVPQLWGRLFGPRTVALLYGARLGVGPATILPTWLWWGAFLVGAACGPWVGAAVGAVFAVARIATTQLAVAGPTEGVAMSRRLSAVRRLDRPVTLAGAFAVGTVVVLLALSARTRSETAPSPSGPRPTVTGEAVPVTTSSSVPFAPELLAMDDLLLDDTLPGFRRDDGAVGAGPLDLDAAAEAEADAEAERAVLETRGFVRGTSRSWVGPGDDVVYVAAYEFARPDGAAAYLVDGMEHVTARGARGFPVPGIDGARGFTMVDGGGTAHGVVLARRHHWVLVLVASPTGSRSAEEAVVVAAAQARRLEGG